MEIRVEEIKEAIGVLREALDYFKEKIERGDIKDLVVDYCYDKKFIKDSKYMVKIYRNWGVVEDFSLLVEKDNKIICNIDLDLLDGKIVKEIEKEIYNMYVRVKELLNNEIKKEFGGDNMEEKEIITEDIMVHIYKANGVKKVRLIFSKNVYELEDVKNILSKLDGINGDVLVLEGRAPIWLYVAIAVHLKNLFKKIYTYDPKIPGFVCIYDLEGIGLGKIEKEEI